MARAAAWTASGRRWLYRRFLAPPEDLQRWLGEHGRFFPPVPTYQEAMIGGTIATDAGGAATFKYGKTRAWVRGVEVLLFNGDLLKVERGECVVPRGGTFRVELAGGRVLEVPTPTYALPAVKKLSCGYWSSDPMDLVDLFVGSEGTLGMIAASTLGLVPLPAAVVAGLAFLPGLGQPGIHVWPGDCCPKQLADLGYCRGADRFSHTDLADGR